MRRLACSFSPLCVSVTTLGPVNSPLVDRLGLGAQDVTILPAALPPSLPEWELRSLPAMVMRQAYTWTSEMHPDLNVHLKLNKGRMHSDAYISGVMDARHGSSIYYASPPGFVHTSFTLAPPAQYNRSHPDAAPLIPYIQ